VILKFRGAKVGEVSTLRFYKIGRFLIFDWIYSGTIYLQKWNGFDLFSIFSTKILSC